MIPTPGSQHSRPLWIAASITAILTPVVYLLALVLVALARGDFSSEAAFRGLIFCLAAGVPFRRSHA